MNKYPENPENIANLMEDTSALQNWAAQRTPETSPRITAGASETPEPANKPLAYDEALESPESREDLEEYITDYITISLEDHVSVEPDDNGDFVTLDDFTLAVDATDLGINEEDLDSLDNLSGSSEVTAHNVNVGDKTQEVSWKAKPIKLGEENGKKYLVYKVTSN